MMTSYLPTFREASLAVFLVVAAHDPALAQSHDKEDFTFPTRKFFAEQPLGSVAIISGKEKKSTQSRRLTFLQRSDYVEGFGDRATCTGVIAHRDDDLKGSSYFGLQIVYVFDRNPAGSAVYVHRNEGWLSRKDSTPLEGMKNAEPVSNASTAAEFAAAHASLSAVQALSTSLGPVADIWHARLPQTETADGKGLSYWHRDPTASDYQFLYKQYAGPTPTIRVENRLLRYEVTTEKNPEKIGKPLDFNFYCGGYDRHLRAVLLRVYSPLLTQPESSYVIAFK
jgi:hypothetical protein